jgi:sialate O-acetylesterase
VGLVISAVGGTPIDAWVDAGAQRAVPELKPLFEAAPAPALDAAKVKADFDAALAKWKEEARAARKAGKAPGRPPRNPLLVRERKANVGGLFNGMVAPLIPFAIRGAIWYQGEANSTPEKAAFYQHQLPLLVTDWRRRWGAEFPFAWVQLPNFLGTGRDWPTVREAMAKTLRLPKTGMAVAIDIGETKDIHPKNKQEAGRRLSLWALAQVYGREDVVFQGPSFSAHETRGGEIMVRFANATGLKTVDGAPPWAFQIAGEDKAWHPAVARIEGTTVILKADGVPQPVAARYAWENDPKCTLVNAAGLPAAPFRTENW